MNMKTINKSNLKRKSHDYAFSDRQSKRAVNINFLETSQKRENENTNDNTNRNTRK